MNATDLVQSKRHVNFACEPLCSYFDECQKNEQYLLYLHFRSFLFTVCEVMI